MEEPVIPPYLPLSRCFGTIGVDRLDGPTENVADTVSEEAKGAAYRLARYANIASWAALFFWWFGRIGLIGSMMLCAVAFILGRRVNSLMGWNMAQMAMRRAWLAAVICCVWVAIVLSWAAYQVPLGSSLP